jgi:hypothetical protein
MRVQATALKLSWSAPMTIEDEAATTVCFFGRTAGKNWASDTQATHAAPFRGDRHCPCPKQMNL